MKTLRQCAIGGISPFFSLLFFFVLFFNHANAQLALINEFTPPSAQASQFTKYGKYNPQLYIGTLSLSIPIYTCKDKDFEIPISLDYSYNGLIANKQASEVGLGWSLGCGGYITREVRGIPDEEMGTIITEAPNLMWGTDGKKFYIEGEGWHWFFGEIDHYNDELISWYIAKRGTRFEALEPIRMAVRERFGNIG